MKIGITYTIILLTNTWIYTKTCHHIIECREDLIVDAAFISEMEKRLLELQEEILKSFISENEDFKKLVSGMDIKDLGDIAADDIMCRKMEALNQHETNRLRSIESALARLKNGRYGICLSCGKTIPLDRLRAIPYAVLCVGCKSGQEDSRKRRA